MVGWWKLDGVLRKENGNRRDLIFLCFDYLYMVKFRFFLRRGRIDLEIWM